MTSGRFTIPLPGFIPLRWSIAVSAVLFLGQVLTGTSLVFAQLIFLFTVLSAVAVNIGGGLSRIGGFCIALMSLKIVVLSQWMKVLMGEAGDYRLHNPTTTAAVLLAGMASVTVGAAFARYFRARSHLFNTPLSLDFLRIAAKVTFCAGVISHLGVLTTGVADGALLVGGVPGLLRQLAFSLSLSVVFSTAVVICESEGKRILAPFNAIPTLVFFSLGVLGASKQGMFEPFLLIGLTAVAFGFRFSPLHFIAGLTLAVLAVVVLFPFAQVARGYTRGFGLLETISVTAEFAHKHLTSAEGFAQLHQQANDANERADLTQYYDRSFGLVERVSLIKMVDLLVTATLRDGRSEWETVTHGFEMVLPRFLYPHKPAINTGTFLGKKAGVISDDDWGTQISFGFIADSFSAFGWAGAAIIPGIVTFAFIGLYHWFSGPLQKNPWTICFFAEFQHVFAEQTISGMTLTMFRRPIWLLAIFALIQMSWFVYRMKKQAPNRSGSFRLSPWPSR